MTGERCRRLGGFDRLNHLGDGRLFAEPLNHLGDALTKVVELVETTGRSRR